MNRNQRYTINKERGLVCNERPYIRTQWIDNLGDPGRCVITILLNYELETSRREHSCIAALIMATDLTKDEFNYYVTSAKTTTLRDPAKHAAEKILANHETVILQQNANVTSRSGIQKLLDLRETNMANSQNVGNVSMEEIQQFKNFMNIALDTIV